MRNDPEVGSRETVRNGLPEARVLGEKRSLSASLGVSYRVRGWVLPSARLSQRPGFDESKKRPPKVGGWKWGKGISWYFSVVGERVRVGAVFPIHDTRFHSRII